jgi:hypothetical protein
MEDIFEKYVILWKDKDKYDSKVILAKNVDEIQENLFDVDFLKHTFFIFLLFYYDFDNIEDFRRLVVFLYNKCNIKEEVKVEGKKKEKKNKGKINPLLKYPLLFNKKKIEKKTLKELTVYSFNKCFKQRKKQFKSDLTRKEIQILCFICGMVPRVINDRLKIYDKKYRTEWCGLNTLPIIKKHFDVKEIIGITQSHTNEYGKYDIDDDEEDDLSEFLYDTLKMTTVFKNFGPNIFPGIIPKDITKDQLEKNLKIIKNSVF